MKAAQAQNQEADCFIPQKCVWSAAALDSRQLHPSVLRAAMRSQVSPVLVLHGPVSLGHLQPCPSLRPLLKGSDPWDHPTRPLVLTPSYPRI